MKRIKNDEMIGMIYYNMEAEAVGGMIYYNMEAEAVESPVECISRYELVQALEEMKTGKSPGPSDISLESNAGSR